MESNSQAKGERFIAKPLFPVEQSKKEEIKSSRSGATLFPAYTQETTTCQPHENQGTGQDWLVNSSYTSVTARKLEAFQKELEDALNTQEDESRSSDVPDPDPADSGPDSRDGVFKREHSHSDSAATDQDVTGRREKSHKKKHKKKHKKHKKRDREPDTADKPDAVVFSSSKVFIEEIPGLTSEHAYRLDRAADRNSWTYGSLYKLHVAKHKRVGNSCLGLPKGVEITFSDHKKSREKHIECRYFSKDNRRQLKTKAEEVILATADSSPGNLSQYIPVTEDKGEHSRETDVRIRILDKSTELYVRGQGPSSADSAGHGEDSIKSHQETGKVAEYNRKLRENPHDVHLWLEFIQFQDRLYTDNSLLGWNTDEKQEKLRNGSQVLLDKKLSIVEKAMQVNPGSIDLQLCHLELRRETWEMSRINRELEKLLFVHPANTQLWKYYLKLNQSKLSSFTVAKVTKLYHKCFKALVSVLSGKVQTARLPDNLELQLVELFVQYCQLLKSSGHKEKAIGTIQAFLELNLFCPPSLESYSLEDKVAVFEGFWDSGVARVGETGAKGWKSWVETKGATAADNSSSARENFEEAEDAIVSSKLPKHQAWLEIEQLRDHHHWLPWQPDVLKGETEEDCEDLDRLVLFDDVSPALFTVAAEKHFHCLLAFLSVLGVNLHCPVLSEHFCFAMPVKSEMYVGLSEMSCQDREEFGKVGQKGMSDAMKSFIVCLVSSLVKQFNGSQQTTLTLILIEFKLSNYSAHIGQRLAKSDCKELRKFVKALLKEDQNRNNLTVWGVYVTLERLIGKPGEALGILETALTMFSGQAPEGQVVKPGLLTLYRLYCEVLLGIKPVQPDTLWERQSAATQPTVQKVVQTLGMSVCGQSFKKPEAGDSSTGMTGTELLKYRTKFKSMLESVRQKLVENGNTDPGVKTQYLEVCRCHALFELCSTGVQAACAVFEKSLAHIQNQELSQPELEQALYTAQLKLILHHMSTSVAPLTLLRTCLDQALERHRESGVFLSLFVDVEQRSRITGRLQKIFDKLTHMSQGRGSPSAAVFAVYSELHLLSMLQARLGLTAEEQLAVPESGIIHRTRAVLERSVCSSGLKHCPLLWRIYLQAEVLFGDKQRLKGIFYRSLQQCPWHKALYLDGVAMLGEEDLQEIVDLMTEKEIRVQIPVEEVDLLLDNV